MRALGGALSPLKGILERFGVLCTRWHGPQRLLSSCSCSSVSGDAACGLAHFNSLENFSGKGVQIVYAALEAMGSYNNYEARGRA